jgi:hypothetical protein
MIVLDLYDKARAEFDKDDLMAILATNRQQTVSPSPHEFLPPIVDVTNIDADFQPQWSLLNFKKIIFIFYCNFKYIYVNLNFNFQIFIIWK